MITLTNRHISCVLSALSLAVAIVDIFISVFHKSISTIYDHDKFDVAFSELVQNLHRIKFGNLLPCCCPLSQTV